MHCKPVRPQISCPPTCLFSAHHDTRSKLFGHKIAPDAFCVYFCELTVSAQFGTYFNSVDLFVSTARCAVCFTSSHRADLNSVSSLVCSVHRMGTEVNVGDEPAVSVGTSYNSIQSVNIVRL